MTELDIYKLIDLEADNLRSKMSLSAINNPIIQNELNSPFLTKIKINK